MKRTILTIGCLWVVVLITLSGCKKELGPIVLDPGTNPEGKIFHWDPVNGNDKSKGSESLPFKTLARLLDTLQAGDVVLMHNGNYGTIVLGRTPGENWGEPNEITVPQSLFTGWVTFKPAPGQNPQITSLEFGTLNIPNSGSPSKQIAFSVKGNADLYVRFEGLKILDGVKINGSRYVSIKNCVINRVGELNGTVENMDSKYGIYIVNGRYITLEGNEITHVSIGIGVASYDAVILNNHIHHNSHDGIRVYGGDHILIESNRIHDLDDGVSDDVNPDWNRHCDGIHLFDLIDLTSHLTVRGNLFYHLEAMGCMLQGEVKNSDWVFENNIFGPVGGVGFLLGTDIYGSCVFRHNTFVYAPNDKWTSIFGRAMQGESYIMNLWGDVPAVNPGYRFYNNILCSSTNVPKEYGFVSKNIFWDPSDKVFPYNAVPGNFDDYVKSKLIPGTLIAGSPAINTGDPKYASELLIDYSGKTRGVIPDIGALEN